MISFCLAPSSLPQGGPGWEKENEGIPVTIQYLERPSGPRLAYCLTPAPAGAPALPLVMFAGGFRSDMQGTKALYLESQCRARRQAYLRFDYSGHGASGGRFEDGLLSLWEKDARDILDNVTDGPVILVGSSMGGWISMLLALDRPGRVCGLVGVAAAPDFTREIYENRLSEGQRRQLHDQGFAEFDNHYENNKYRLTRAFFDDANSLCLLDKSKSFAMKLRLVQGMKDPDVPWQAAFRIKKAVEGDVEVILVENGDHRLSRPEDLALIDEQVRILSGLKNPD